MCKVLMVLELVPVVLEVVSQLLLQLFLLQLCVLLKLPCPPWVGDIFVFPSEVCIWRSRALLGSSCALRGLLECLLGATCLLLGALLGLLHARTAA